MTDDTPRGFDHWRGTVDQRITDHERRLLSINGNIAKGTEAITLLTLEVGKLATKVALYAAIGGFIASTATGAAVFFLTK